MVLRLYIRQVVATNEVEKRAVLSSLSGSTNILVDSLIQTAARKPTVSTVGGSAAFTSFYA